MAARVHGPYADADSASAAEVTAGALRYLNHAAPRGGVTEPATVTTVAAHLAATAHRLPQLLTQLAEWLAAEAAAGRSPTTTAAPPGSSRTPPVSCSGKPPSTPTTSLALKRRRQPHRQPARRRPRHAGRLM